MTTVSNPVRSKAPKPVHVQQGVAHGTPATRQIHALALGTSRSSTTRKRRSSSTGKKKAPRTRKASTATATAGRSGKAHLVKGSAAAKRKMAQLRAMRTKKAGG